MISFHIYKLVIVFTEDEEARIILIVIIITTTVLGDILPAVILVIAGPVKKPLNSASFRRQEEASKWSF